VALRLVGSTKTTTRGVTTCAETLIRSAESTCARRKDRSIPPESPDGCVDAKRRSQRNSGDCREALHRSPLVPPVEHVPGPREDDERAPISPNIAIGRGTNPERYMSERSRWRTASFSPIEPSVDSATSGPCAAGVHAPEVGLVVGRAGDAEQVEAGSDLCAESADPRSRHPRNDAKSTLIFSGIGTGQPCPAS
jgi:hypothetical protein